jgi:hypothetical protein
MEMLIDEDEDEDEGDNEGDGLRRRAIDEVGHIHLSDLVFCLPISRV